MIIHPQNLQSSLPWNHFLTPPPNSTPRLYLNNIITNFDNFRKTFDNFRTILWKLFYNFFYKVLLKSCQMMWEFYFSKVWLWSVKSVCRGRRGGQKRFQGLWQTTLQMFRVLLDQEATTSQLAQLYVILFWVFPFCVFPFWVFPFWVFPFWVFPFWVIPVRG
jgi:hypothetical protein